MLNAFKFISYLSNCETFSKKIYVTVGLCRFLIEDNCIRETSMKYVDDKLLLKYKYWTFILINFIFN